MEFLSDVFVGVLSFAVTYFFVNPLVRIFRIKQEMHEAIMLYANIWRGDDAYNAQRVCEARYVYRKLAARGLAESECLKSWFYFLPYLYCYLCKIDLKQAAEKFWQMEADAASPDACFRRRVVNEIRNNLNLSSTCF